MGDLLLCGQTLARHCCGLQGQARLSAVRRCLEQQLAQGSMPGILALEGRGGGTMSLPQKTHQQGASLGPVFSTTT